MLREVLELEVGLRDSARRDESLHYLRGILSKWSRSASSEAPPPERSQARRLLRAITGGARERVEDDDYRKLLEQYGLGARR